MEGPLLEAGTRTSTVSSARVRSTVEDRGVMLFLDVTAAPEAEEEIELSIEAIDETSGNGVSIAKFDSITGGEAFEAHALAAAVYPSGAETEVSVQDCEISPVPLPRHWRAKVTHSGGGSWTYSLSYQALQ